MLGIMGTALSVFCPFLSQFTDMRARDIFSTWQQLVPPMERQRCG
jgi:hypothetical protein